VMFFVLLNLMTCRLVILSVIQKQGMMQMASGNSKVTAVRLPPGIVKKIDALVGKGNRSRFIAAAIERELKRRARLAYIEGAEGFFNDDLDTLAFVNRLRASDERVK